MHRACWGSMDSGFAEAMKAGKAKATSRVKKCTFRHEGSAPRLVSEKVETCCNEPPDAEVPAELGGERRLEELGGTDLGKP